MTTSKNPRPAADAGADEAIARAVGGAAEKARAAVVAGLRSAQMEMGTLVAVLDVQDGPENKSFREMVGRWKAAVTEARRLLSERSA